jgi:hypothetical protein
LVGRLLNLPIVREVRSNIAVQTVKAGVPLPPGVIGAIRACALSHPTLLR